MDRWIVIADSRAARLVLFRALAGGHWHAEAGGVIESRWVDREERGRPVRLGGRSSSAHEHLLPTESEGVDAEMRRRFAQDVVDWLETSCGPRLREDPEVFAAAGFFGALRRELQDRHHPLGIHEVSLGNLRVDDLAQHPAVIEAIGSVPKHPYGRHFE
jgi:hypothetical protein